MDSENLALTLRDNAKNQLAQIKDIETGITYLNKVKAIEVWAKAEKKDAELQNIIAEQKIRTQRVLGTLIREGQINGEIKKPKDTLKQNTVVTSYDNGRSKTLSQLGIENRNNASAWQQIASLPTEVFEQQITEAKKGELTTSAILQAAKNHNRQERNEEKKPSLIPEGIFDIIYCDPPWQYDFSETDSRKIENQYPTMTVDELCKMELPCIAENALLLMWATAPKLIEALKVIEAWKFIYKTHGIWDKEKIGMGYWFRGQHELLLIATKGNFSPPEPEYRFSSVHKEARKNHSCKPDFYYGWIEQAFTGNKIELFARQKRHGWEAWGNE